MTNLEKEKYLPIIKEYYGFTTKEAKTYLQGITHKDTLESIKQNWQENARKSFYED